MENADAVIGIAKRLMNQWIQDYYHKKDVEVGNIYYAGGTLCVDLINTQTRDLFMLGMFNISTETVTRIKDGVERKRLLPLEHLKTLFVLYLHIKGKTPYYLQCYEKSCLKYLYDINMNKRDEPCKPLIDKYLWEVGITGGKTAKEVGEALSQWKKSNHFRF